MFLCTYVCVVAYTYIQCVSFSVHVWYVNNVHFLNVIFNLYKRIPKYSVSLFCDGFCLQIGQDIEVRPGIVSKNTDGKIVCQPILSRVISLFAEQNDLQYAVPGGLIGVLTCYHGDVII